MKILFVCTGNICRSPTAEAVLRHKLKEAGLSDRITVESAGTHGYHEGEAPDTRSQTAALKRGVSLEGLIARRVTPTDYTEYDMILALDKSHFQALHQMRPGNSTAAIDLFLDYADHPFATDVPDPYYGSESDFEEVLDLVEAGSDSLIKKLRLLLD